ncbi:Protein fam13a, partial [Clonorchis sinensis]
MERLIRKINTSPKARQKYTSEGSKQFGVPLKFLVNSATGDFVPAIVCNICECILQNGLSLQGIFRVNGGVRLIETLKRSLERSGGCSLNITEATELYALAGVLKLFLREIPDGLIPKEHTMQFVQVVTESEQNESVDTIKLEALVQQLPEENAHLLHYLCRFLATVSRNECENKMSVQSLGILFGPCVFRFDFSSQGLRFQSSVNQVMAVLIQYHADIFRQFSAPTEPRVTFPRPELRKSAFVSSSDDETPSSLRANSLSITDSAEKNFFSTLFSDRSGNRYTTERLELLPSIESALLDLPSYVSLSPHPTLLRTSFSKSDCMNWSHHESVSWLPSCPPSDLASVSAVCEQSDTDTDLDAMQTQPVDPLTTVDFVLQTARDSCVADPIIQPPDYKTDLVASSASSPKVELKAYRCGAEMNFPTLSDIPKRESFDVSSPADFYTNPLPNKPTIDPHLVDNPELDILQISRVVCRTFSLPFQKSHKQSYQPHHHTFPHGSKVPLCDLFHERLGRADRMLYSAALPETGMPSSFTPDHSENISFPLASLEKRSKSVCRSTDDVFDSLRNATCLPVDGSSCGIRQRLGLPMSATRCSKSLEDIRYTAPFVSYPKDREWSAPQSTEGRQSPLSIPLRATEHTTKQCGYRNVPSVPEKDADKPTDPTMNVDEQEGIVTPSTTNFVSLSSLQSFQELFTAVLEEQRRRCGRPELLSLLTAEQIKQEKIDLQKGLLYFEQLHGRPQNPESKRIMRPFYERYRQVKRLLRAIEK